MIEHDISLEYQNRNVARTGADEFVAIDRGPSTTEPFRLIEILVVQNAEGLRTPARWMGVIERLDTDIGSVSVAGRFEVDPSGRPLTDYIDSTANSGRNHDWGALGLPNGQNTRVRQLASDTTFNHAQAAAESAGAWHLEQDASLKLVPGDNIRVGTQIAQIVAIDRRTGAIELEVDGVTQLVSISEIAAGEI